MTNLVLQWIKDKGGIDAIHSLNEVFLFSYFYLLPPFKRKASMLYSIIENSNGFFHCGVDPVYRSQMNVVFRIGGPKGDDALEAEFIKGAVERHMVSLKGHRYVFVHPSYSL